MNLPDLLFLPLVRVQKLLHGARYTRVDGSVKLVSVSMGS